MGIRKAVVIVGPTAVGKTALSIVLAKAYEGEVISADSRQVYRGLDIGSGKVTKEEMEGVPHHLLDVADPTDRFTAQEYAALGRKALEDILSRDKLPLIVGGTGFYIDALLGITPLSHVPPNDALREALETLSLEELQERLKKNDPERFETIDIKNRVRLIRAIEISEGVPNENTLPSMEHVETLWLGLTLPGDVIKGNIEKRLQARLAIGMLDEAKTLLENGIPLERLDELGLEYRFMARHLNGDISQEEMEQLIVSESIKYAKRQMTWFKRNKDIVWIEPNKKERALGLTRSFLSKS